MTKRDFVKQFERIQKDRKGVVESSVYPGIKELVSEIYPEEAHFIYELLQNAEDANASEVEFEIRKNMMVFRHNGTDLFDADDVDSITNIAKSTKKENYVQAGKFGIGFKSVYAFTDTPSIYCDSVCFRIDQLLLPIQIEDLPGRNKGWTEFYFPFDSPKISAVEAKEKIRQGLMEIESTTLLFLNKIHHLKYTLEDKSSYCVDKVNNGRIITCSVLKGNKCIQKESWMRFSKDSQLNGKAVQVDIAFPMIYKDKEKIYDFLIGEDKVCIRFLAKNEKSNLRFYINAPFGCTPSRDTVNKGDKANKILIKEISSLMQSSITELREEDYLTDDFFELLPIEEDDIPEFYQPIVEAIKKSFADKKNLPTMVEGQFVTVENGIMSRRDVIDRIFTQKDIRTLFQNMNLCFVKNRPINTRAYKFLKSLEIKDLSPEAVMIQMANVGNKALVSWLETRTDERLAELYGFLSKGIDNLEQQAEKYEDYEDYVTDDWFRKKHGNDEQVRLGNLYLNLCNQIERVKQITIVKTTDNEFVKASSAYIVEKGIEVPSEYKTVKINLYKKDNEKKFLKSMGIKSFTYEELQGYQYKNEICNLEKMLAEMNKAKTQNSTDPLSLTRSILKFLKDHKNEEIKWNKYRIVYAQNYKDKIKGWYCLSECCLDKPLFTETGLESAAPIHKKHTVDEIYNKLDDKEKNLWIDFLKRNGVFWKIKVEHIERSTGYVTGRDSNYEIPYLKAFLDLHNIKLSRYIWKSLSTEYGWSYIYNYKYYQINKNRETTVQDSTALTLLKNSRWVPDKDGIFKSPRDLSRDTIDTSFIIDESNGFLDAIKFGENAQKKEQEERAKREKEYLEQEQQKEAAKRLGFDSTEEVLAFREDLRLLSQLRELFDINELITEGEKKRKEKERKSLDFMLSSRKDEMFREGDSKGYDDAPTVKNPERRREKLEEELSEDKEERKTKISIRKSTISNQEEKMFLYNQYSGRCQICSKMIVKKDGSYYFEAINLMDTSELEEKYQTGLSIGWNSLCLCPNCAAEYKYGAISQYDFHEKVMEMTIDKSIDDFVEFPIRMQGEDRKLKYSPVHLFSLQTALKFFNSKLSEDIEKADDVKGEQTKDELSILQTITATKIKKIDSGDSCPDCGKKNTCSQLINVTNLKCIENKIEALLCECGTIYLTRRLFRKLTFPLDYNIIEVEPYSANNSSAVRENIVVPRHNKLKKKKKNTVINTNKNVMTKGTSQRCRKCGSSKTFYGSGLCWSCYKEEKMSIYYD